MRCGWIHRSCISARPSAWPVHSAKAELSAQEEFICLGVPSQGPAGKQDLGVLWELHEATGKSALGAWLSDARVETSRDRRDVKTVPLVRARPNHSDDLLRCC